MANRVLVCPKCGMPIPLGTSLFNHLCRSRGPEEKKP